ncbi:4-oxalocrotonate tautomerase DmpI [Bilophila wadsworthia]|uniref:4-oxalocrotonate tautomerase DmpI n=1 Tax=Bilophila wadsworthia TaxID=35833 RepID=UPI003AAC36AC
MPVITLEAASLSKEQKALLVSEFTASAARIMDLPKTAFYVFLKENGADNVGVGGVLLSDRKQAQRGSG